MENIKWEYRRALLMTDVPVKGMYRYNDLFQILPTEQSAPMPPAVIGHYPCIIEFRFIINETPIKNINGDNWPQWVVNNDDAKKVLKEILLILNLFLRDRIFYYNSSQSWFIPTGNARIEKVQWGQQGYYYDEFESQIYTFSEENIIPIEFIDANKYFYRYGKVIGSAFDLPDNIDTLLTQYFNLSDVKQPVFLSACSLLYQGIKLWGEHPSLSFAALVSSLETLIEVDSKKIKNESCKECGEKIYNVTEKFRDFFGKYGSPSSEFREYATKIYKQRSKILHRGKLFLGEIIPIRFTGEMNFEENDFRRNVVRTCRICMINWLLQQNNT